MVLTGNLAVPIGVHFGWNVVQNNVLGLPNGGKPPVASLLAADVTGPQSLSGGAFGPEGSALMPIAAVVAMVSTIVWVRIRRGKVALCLSLAEPRVRTRADNHPTVA
jgi:hypothetical protein